MKSRIRQWLVEGASRTLTARLTALVVVPVLVACADGTGPARLVSITPESQFVSLEQSPNGAHLKTSVTLTNTSSSSLVYDPCALSLEKKIEGYMLADGEPTYPWVRVWAPICVLLSSETVSIMRITLLPHTSVMIPIDAQVASSTFPQFDGSPGTYRIYLALQTTLVGVPREIPHDFSVSDPFTVVVQRGPLQ